MVWWCACSYPDAANAGPLARTNPAHAASGTGRARPRSAMISMHHHDLQRAHRSHHQFPEAPRRELGPQSGARRWSRPPPPPLVPPRGGLARSLWGALEKSTCAPPQQARLRRRSRVWRSVPSQPRHPRNPGQAHRDPVAAVRMTPNSGDPPPRAKNRSVDRILVAAPGALAAGVAYPGEAPHAP